MYIVVTYDLTYQNYSTGEPLSTESYTMHINIVILYEPPHDHFHRSPTYLMHRVGYMVTSLRVTLNHVSFLDQSHPTA